MGQREDDDAALVRQYLASGDSELFGELVDRHQSRVFRLVCSVLGPGASQSGEAEEVTQEVFVRVFRQLSQYRGESLFSSWLYRIAYRSAVDVKRLARMRYPHESRTVDHAAPDTSDGIDTRRAVDALPDLYRTLMHMYYWLDCPVSEIAEVLAMNPGTVKSYLARAREIVRSRL